MKDRILLIAKKSLGVILIIGGFLGLFLPFFQGVAMIIAGAILLDNRYIMIRVRRFIDYLKKRRKKK